MRPGADQPGPAFPDPDTYARTRDLLQSVGFTAEGIREAVGVKDIFTPAAADLPAFLHRTRDGSPLSTLLRLFNFAVPVDAGAAREALLPLDLSAFEEAGLVEATEGQIRPLVRIRAVPGLWLLCELPLSLDGDRAGDRLVMDLGASSLMLAEMTMRRRVPEILDLGAGCGYQALRAACHCDRVTATDVNPRAVAFTEFSALLNGLDNVEALSGDLFEPVSGRTFDLIVCNPPYVITPETTLTFRDGDAAGDGFVQRVIRELPPFLVENGHAQLVCEWAHRRGVPWPERVEGWFEATGCDAWVLRKETTDPDIYASRWIAQTESRDPARRSRLHERWLAYYEEQGIEAISFGVVTMRRASGRANWFHSDDSLPDLLGSAGDDVETLFAARDFLHRFPESAALEAATPRLSPAVRLRQELIPKGDGWHAERIELRRVEGLGYRAGTDPYVAGLVARMNGERTIGELLRELAVQADGNVAEMREPVYETVRTLLLQGFLTL